jgi:hypothetical protein
MEFIYTNRVADIRDISTDDLLRIQHLSDKWLIGGLKRLVDDALRDPAASTRPSILLLLPQ